MSEPRPPPRIADPSARRNADRRARRWGRGRLRRFGWPLALVLGGSLAGPSFAQTLPQGGSIVGGSGAIQYASPNLLTVQQASDYLAIDWQSFSVGAGQTVRFVQPSSSALALNRVVGADPSQIFGQIQANGRVILLNPNGIYFGPSSHVDVNALVASTAGIRTDDFMAGTLRFDQASANSDARVVNEGLVSVAQGGFAVLAAAAVQNTGRIVANGGTVVLAGTPTFAVDFHGDGLLNFAATGVVDRAPAGAAALVDNSGVVEAAGGRVLLTARAARDVLDNVINTSGIVVATTAQMVNGEIVIDGGDSGIVNVSGTLDASGRGAGETGGTVKVLGEKVALLADSRIDAAGDAGGGTVLAGGNFQGQGPEPNARMLYMDARAVIDASAAAQGDGGRVILWADETTRFDGTILARAGAAGGDGGFVETSGKIVLRVGLGAHVDASAVSGANGSWLLDPNNIAIVSGGGASTNVTGDPVFLSTDDNAQIYDSTISAALDLGNDVTVTTGTGGANAQAGDITVSGTIINSTGGARTLTLTAAGSISITGTGGIDGSSGNSLAVVLDAPTGGVAINGGIDTWGGALTINAATAVTQTAAVTSGAGTLPLILNLTGSATANLTTAGNYFFQITLNSTSTGSINIATATTPQLQASSIAGDLTLTAPTSGFIQSGALTATGGGTVTIDGGTGNITLSQANAFSGNLFVTGNQITTSAAQTFTLGGPSTLSLVSGGGIFVGGDIAASGAPLDIEMRARSGVSSDASATYGAIVLNGNVTTNGGWIVLGGGDTPLTDTMPTIGALGDGTNVNGIFIGPTGANTIDTGGGNFWARGRGNDLGNAQSRGFVTAQSIATGGGDITIAGVSGTGSAAGHGIEVYLVAVDAGGGSIALTGTGNGSAASMGVVLDGAIVQTAAAGTIDISGTALFAGSDGLRLQSSDVESTGSGPIALVGAGAGGGFGIATSGTASTVGGVSATGNILILADSISLDTNFAAQTAGAIQIEPSNPGTDVFFNGTGAGLQLTSAFLGSLTGYSALLVGSPAMTGTLDVAAAFTAPAGASIDLISGGPVTVNGALTTSGGGSIVLTSIGGTVSVVAALASGGAPILIEGDAGIDISANITSGGGDISLWGNSPGGTLGGVGATAAHGVLVDGATVDAGGGNIEIAGTGGTSDYQHGVAIRNGAGIVTSGTGAIDIAGEAGTGTAGSAVGVEFYAGGAYAQTQHGALNVTGYGSTGGGHGNSGVTLATGEIRATGTGAVTVTGVGGAGGSVGVTVGGGGATKISTVDGDLTIDATGGSGDQAGTLFAAAHSWGILVGADGGAWLGTVESTGAGNVVVAASAGASAGDYRVGALVLEGGIVRATGSGSVSLVGAGGTGSGSANDGVMIADGTVGAQGAGNVTVRGVATLGTGLVFDGTTATLGDAAMTGNMTLRADTFANTSAGLSILRAGGGGTVTFRTDNDATTIGVAGGTGTAQITAAMIGAVSGFEQVHIGFPSQTGAIDTGPLTMTRNLWLQTAGTITAGALTMGANELDVANGGAFTQTGAIASTGLVKFSDAGDVTATHASNAFEFLEIDKNNPANVTVSTTVPLDLSYVTMDTGALSITADGIAQVAPISTNGSAFFDGGAGGVLLTDPGNYIGGAIRLATTGAGDAVLANSLGVQFGNGTTAVGGNLAIIATGAITQISDLAVGGNATFDALTGAVTLGNAGNAVGGDVAFASIGGAVTWREAGAVAIGLSNAGTMDVQAGGAITQTGGILTGAASFDAGANAITLNDVGNVFTGSVALATTAAADASLTAFGPLDLAASAVGGNLAVAKSGGGDLTQSGALAVGGNLSANAGGGLILLNQGANAIAGTVSLDSTGAGTNVFQNGAPLAFGTVAITGNLDATANTGAISQTAAMTVGGDASFTAGAFAITLDDPGNAVGGTVSLANTGAAAVSWREAGVVSLGASTVGGFTLQAGGTVTQAGALAVTGNAVVSTSAGDIVLGNAANAVSGDIVLTGSGAGVVVWTEAGAVQLGATAAADLTVLAGGAITQSGAISTTGVASFTTGAAAITLANPTNMFGGLALSNSGANAVDVQATGPLDIVSASVGSGAFSVDTDGALTQSGAILQSGAGALALTGASVALTNGGNVLLGSVTLTANSGAAALSNSVATDIAGVAAAGDFTLISGGDVTQSGAIAVAAGNDSGVLASGSVVTLTNGANDFGDTLTLSGASGAIDGAIATLTGAPAAAFATAIAGTFSVNGVTVSSTPPPPPATTTAAVLNEISTVAPIDTALRVEAPPIVGGGFTAPSIQASLSLAAADLGGGGLAGGPAAGGGAQADGGTPGGPADETAGPVFGPAPTPSAPAGTGAQPADGAAPAAASDAPRVVLSEPAGPAGPGTPAAGGGATVRATPAVPQGGPVTLVPGLLVQGGVTGSAPAPAGSSTFSQSWPQSGNFQ